MSTSPVQPDLLQYPISDLYLFAEYLTRAAYLAATGSQAPPFNPALPVKQWLDPNPTGQPYLAFDTTAGKTVELPIPAAVASAVNLPGAYNYPAFQDTPTDATLDWPYGVVSQINSDTVCLLPNAQALLPQLQPLMPAGKTLSVVDSSEVGVFHTVYGQTAASGVWRSTVCSTATRRLSSCSRLPAVWARRATGCTDRSLESRSPRCISNGFRIRR